jgi:hypothetical protein
MDQDCPVDRMDAEAPAFAGLRAEISLLRRAVERLTDERTDQPDFAPHLEAIAKHPEDLGVEAAAGMKAATARADAARKLGTDMSAAGRNMMVKAHPQDSAGSRLQRRATTIRRQVIR